MRRSSPLPHSLLVLAACACASAGTPHEETTPRQATILVDPSSGILLAERPRSSATTVAAPPATVWTAAKKVYAALGIPVTVDNPTAHQLGNANFYASRRLANQPMTQFVDCGNGMTGQKAATYRIYMSLLTTIESDGGSGTRVNTTFVPMGQDVTEGSTDRIACASKGAFEKLVLDQIAATAAKP
jgi:hypothetical protein